MFSMIAACSGGSTATGELRGGGDTTVSGDVGEDWASASGDRGTPSSLEGRSSYWAVLLQSFPASRGAHRAAAAQLIQRSAQLDPAFRRAFIHTDDRGSMVLFGQHGSVNAPEAQADLDFVKSISLEGQQLFGRAMLTRIRIPRDPASIGPNELLSVRVQRPQYRELYTFQIGVWGTFAEYAERGEKVMSWSEVRQAAERNVAALRSQGYQAYYHHDEDKELSMVTVGVFDRSAYDAQAGLYLNPRLEQLAREFTSHEINGEEVLIQRRDRQVPQRPLLVLIPELP